MKKFMLATALLAATLTGGCVPIEAIEQCDKEAHYAHGHANDPLLPREAQIIGRANCGAWCAQRYSLTGQEVPGSESWDIVRSNR